MSNDEMAPQRASILSNFIISTRGAAKHLYTLLLNKVVKLNNPTHSQSIYETGNASAPLRGHSIYLLLIRHFRVSSAKSTITSHQQTFHRYTV